MKRCFHKFLYLLIMLPLVVAMAGCTVPFLGTDTSEEDMLLNNEALIPPAPVKKETIEQTREGNEKEQDAEIKLSDKNAVFDIDSGGRTTPFVPYRERNLTYSSLDFGDLPLPPGSGEMDEILSSLITAKVTGILYDDASPSAIINVLDDDYLVKPGDKVESFQIESISQDYVAIKTGSNIYRAKVGDIVDGELYGTGVYNLGHRFAGTYMPARDEDVIVIETKKKSQQENKSEGNSLKDLTLPPAPEIKSSGQQDLPLPPAPKL